MRDLIFHIVEFSRRHAVTVALIGLVLTGISGYYAAVHLTIDTDIDKLLDPNLPWRQREVAFGVLPPVGRFTAGFACEDMALLLPAIPLVIRIVPFALM